MNIICVNHRLRFDHNATKLCPKDGAPYVRQYKTQVCPTLFSKCSHLCFFPPAFFFLWVLFLKNSLKKTNFHFFTYFSFKTSFDGVFTP